MTLINSVVLNSIGKYPYVNKDDVQREFFSPYKKNAVHRYFSDSYFIEDIYSSLLSHQKKKFTLGD